MAVSSVALSEEEAYLLAIIEDESGIDLAEFLWEDPMADNEEQIFRCWDFQYAWWRNTFEKGTPIERPTRVIDQCARAVGKTQSIIVRAWAFGLQHPGGEMVVTAPELVHLQPLTARIEDKIKGIRLTREILPGGVGMGFKHRPFHVDFKNGAKILGRIPQKDGKGVKGLHPLKLEMDEAQDFPQAGWIELIETLQHGKDDSQWRAHGVSRGVRDEFYRHSQAGSGWTVHTLTGMHRPNWTNQERNDKIQAYGSRDSPDYKRNILGVHGDATNPLFVLHRLMACVDDDEGSDYNDKWYYYRRISAEMIEDQSIEDLIVIPRSHRKWKNTWAGMDVGMTNAPSEILIFGEEPKKGDVSLRLLTRIHLERIRSADQRKVIELLFDEYDLRLFCLDRGGIGLPLYQELQDGAKHLMNRVAGYNADQKLTVGWAEHEPHEDPDDYEIKRQAKEFGYDSLRTLVDQERLHLPWDMELLGEWQGQTYVRDKSETNPYGKKVFAKGSFHTLDAAGMMIVGRELKTISTMTKMNKEPERVPIFFA